MQRLLNWVCVWLSLAGGLQAAEFLLLPPSWADRVVFYHAFEQGLARPEINTVAVRVQGNCAVQTNGLTGNGCASPLRLTSPGLSVHQPLTVMAWWRLNAPMQETTGFGLLQLFGTGYIANFVAGKGDWCALREPTRISQIINFPNIKNVANPWGGRAWFEPGTWHHVALTVSAAAEVRIYWDGRLKETILVRGRPFQAGDTTALEIGGVNAVGGGHPLTLDEVIVANRALSSEEIADYYLAVQKLTEQNSPGHSPQKENQY